MTLLAVQQVLSRVLTDPAFRETFFREPTSVSLEYPLSARELASLGSLDRARVETCAAMLLRDRVRFALYAFPASGRLLGPLMPELARRFAQRFPPVPTEEPRLEREGPRMLTFALELLAAGELGPAYLGDVMSFEYALYHLSNSEEAWQSAQEVATSAPPGSSPPSVEEVLTSVPWTGAHVALRVFGYDVVDLTNRLSRGELPESSPPRRTIMLLTRTVASPNIRRQRVNDPTRVLLSLCDGTQTTGEIVDALVHRLGAPSLADTNGFVERTVAALRRLREAGVIGLSDGDSDRGPTRRPRSEATLAGILEGSAV